MSRATRSWRFARLAGLIWKDDRTGTVNMDIAKLLGGLKDKVLDAGHLELLRSAYDMQNETITQLKNNNEPLREGNDLLREKNEGLVEKIDRLTADNASLREQVPAESTAEVEYKPSPMPAAILSQFHLQDKPDLWNDELIDLLPNSRIEVLSALSELTENNIAEVGIVAEDGRCRYSLTSEGRRLVLKMAAGRAKVSDGPHNPREPPSLGPPRVSIGKSVVRTTGEEPDKETYGCLNCGVPVKLTDDTDTLLPCPKCSRTDFDKVG